MRTARKGDLLGRVGDPSLERGIADLLSEPDHARDTMPGVLAEPAKRRQFDFIRCYCVSKMIATRTYHDCGPESMSWQFVAPVKENEKGPGRVI